MSARPLSTARSLLFVPADRPERYAKALASGADAVVVDLEDAVAVPRREAARAALRQAWDGLAPDERSRLLVRINAEGTPWHAQDRILVGILALQGLGGIMLAKAEQPATLAAIAAACPGTTLVPLIESARGLAAIDALAAAPGVLRLALGHIDLQLDLGVASGPDEAELAPARWSLVLASRCAGLAPPIDGVTTATGDAEALARDAARARRAGFGGKLCIHPAQVAGVHAAFCPSEAERAWARRVLDAAENAQGGVCSLEGRMVDAPVIALARRVLAD